MARTRTEEIVISGLKLRQKKERNYKYLGMFAIAISMAFLLVLLISITSKGIPGFLQYYATLEIELNKERLDPRGDMSDQSLFEGEAKQIINEAIFEVYPSKYKK